MIDLTYLKNVSGNDAEFIRTMVDNFLQYAPQYVEEMQAAHQQSDWSLVAKTAHKLKPGAVYMGAASLHLQIVDLEAYLKKGDIDTNRVAREVEQINSNCQQVCAALTSAL